MNWKSASLGVLFGGAVAGGGTAAFFLTRPAPTVLTFPKRGDMFSGVVQRVHDGDTVTMLYGGNEIEIRLYGIDAPELQQNCYRRGNGQTQRIACGENIQRDLSNRVNGKTITCEYVEPSYNRHVARCRLNGVDIALESIRQGFGYEAETLVREPYRNEQDAARRRESGIWAFQMMEPKRWRQVCDPPRKRHEPMPDGC